jgi:hypothetical protein
MCLGKQISRSFGASVILPILTDFPSINIWFSVLDTSCVTNTITSDES